jgi:isocitrate/isopropylmalate dehydrogenase
MTAPAQAVRLVRCADCGRPDTPGRVVCPGCLSARLEPYDVPGEGTVATFTTIRRAPARFRDEQPYDVVVTTNQFGDILTDEGAGLVGGLGLAPGLCIGAHQAMAQATHGSAPDIAGQNIANPYAMIMSGKMLFEWLGHQRGLPEAVAAAAAIDAAMDAVIADAQALTGDLGGNGSTREMGDAVVAAIG